MSRTKVNFFQTAKKPILAQDGFHRTVISLTICLLVVLEGEHLSNFSQALGSPLSEQNLRPDLDKLGVLDEPEHDAGLVTALHPLDREDALDDSSLPDVADVDCGLEPRDDLRGMEEDTDISLGDRNVQYIKIFVVIFSPGSTDTRWAGCSGG